MSWLGYTVRIAEMRNTYKIFVGKPEGNTPLVRRRVWEDNIRMDIREIQNRDSSVNIALDYGLDDRGSRVRFPAGVGNFSLHHRVQNGSGAHPASFPMGTWFSFPGGKAAGA
jgi:hypothetical protein